MLAVLPTFIATLATLATLAAATMTAATTPAATAPPPATAPPSATAPAATVTAATECPSPAQLAETLNARVPGLAPATPGAPLPLASGMSLAVVTSPEGDVRVDLVDAKGEPVLHRLLPAPPRGHAPDCPALAETIAIIVERYLHDIGYEAPPLPPPEPKPAPRAPPEPSAVAVVVAAAPPPDRPTPRAALWRLGLAASGRRGDAGGLDGDADLALGVEGTGTGARPAARLSVGLAPLATAEWTNARASLERIPCRLGVYLRIPAGPGQLEPGVGGGADVLVVSVHGPGTASGSHLAAFGDLSLGYTLSLFGPVYGRLLSRAALSAPYTFKTLAGAEVWGTPRAYGEVGVELGVSFP